jgi:cytochrome P450
MAEDAHELTRYAEVIAAVANPSLVPVPPASDAARNSPATLGTAAWLRESVARFASGPVHESRRAIIEAELDRLDPEALRQTAALATKDARDAFDARLIAVQVLAEALGLANPEDVAHDVAIVAGVYFGGESVEADAAVARLLVVVQHDGERDPETSANRIGLLVQACDATAALVNRTRKAAGREVSAAEYDVDALIAETLRHDPPARAIHRVALRATTVAGTVIAAGERVTLNLVAANRDPAVFERPDEFDPGRPEPATAALTFGSEPRRCPGRRQALALAAGILTALPD